MLVAAVFGAGHLEKQLKVGGFSLPGTEFNTASKLLSDDLQISSDRATVVVYSSPTLRATDKPFADAVEGSLARLGKLPYVTKVQSFYDPGLPFLVSDDNHTTYAIVTMKGSENFLQTETPSIRKLANAPPLVTQLVGQSAVNYDVQKASAEDLVKVERFTLPIVALLLILVFGSVIAASVPLVMGDRHGRRRARGRLPARARLRRLDLRAEHRHDDRARARDRLLADHGQPLPRGVTSRAARGGARADAPDRRPLDHLLRDHARADDGACSPCSR